MNGQLNEHPLAELIREISAEALSGALRLSFERAKTVVYFDSGELISAASNLRAYRLPECLRRWGALNERQLARAPQTASDLECGLALVKAGELSSEALRDLRARQCSEILCHALLWTTGEWEFDPRVRLPEEARATIRPQELLMESARRLPTDFVARRFRREDESLAPEPQEADQIDLLPTEAFVLTRVDAPLSLRHLLAVAGLPEAETLRVVYTLTLGGLLRRESWPQALTEQDLRKARSARDARSSASEPEAPAQEKIAPASVEVKAAPVEQRDEREELEELFTRLNVATNHYQVLGIIRTARDTEIKRAYHALAKRFHPDRFRKNADDALHARVEAAFARIAQAYEALKDKQARATYDMRLPQMEEAARAALSRTRSQSGENSVRVPTANGFNSSQGGSQMDAGAAAFRAEEKFKQGLAALRSGNRALAVAALSEAVGLVPTQPRYRAYYGQALAGDERLRRSAETEIKAAIGMDASNPTYRMILAEFYNEIGLLRRAQGELERVLAIAPDHEPARQMLHKLKGKS